MNDSSTPTQDSYDAIAGQWHAARRPFGARPYLESILGGLPSGARVLDLGCGTGHEGFTSEMYGRTFFYSGHEPEEALRLLRAEGFEVELCEEDDPSSRGHIAVVARKV